ncbi:hypothetical protein D3C73_1441840 [compost metagenome]
MSDNEYSPAAFGFLGANKQYTVLTDETASEASSLGAFDTCTVVADLAPNVVATSTPRDPASAVYNVSGKPM